MSLQGYVSHFRLTAISRCDKIRLYSHSGEQVHYLEGWVSMQRNNQLTKDKLQLPREEILKILEAADHMIGRAGRNLLTKLLKGSKEKKLRELELDQLPEYGALRPYTLEEIGHKVEWMIHHEFLEIDHIGYKRSMPVIVFTDKGWEIQRDQCAEELLREWTQWADKGHVPDSMDYLKDRNREMILLFLEKVQATGDPQFIPLLEKWRPIDYAKVRAAIGEVLAHLQTHPVRDEQVFAAHREQVDRLLGLPGLITERLKCWECATRFDYTVEEQMRFKSLGYEPPKRCPECREKKWLRRMGIDEGWE